MLDPVARRVLSPALTRAGSALADAGVSAVAVTAAGVVVGGGACVAAGLGWWSWALALWLLNRLIDGVDGPVARRRGSTELGGLLDIVADFAIYAGFVVGVAVAVPAARLACAVLLAAYYVSGSTFLAVSSLLERLDRAGAAHEDGRSLRFVGGLAEGTETVLAYVLICLLPTHAEVVVWIFAVLVAVTAGQRLVFGVRVLAA